MSETDQQASLDLDAITEDVEMAARSPEMARHVALDHTPHLIARIHELESKVKFALEHGADEYGYCEGWAHGYAAAQQRITEFVHERGVETLDAVFADIERREMA